MTTAILTNSGPLAPVIAQPTKQEDPMPDHTYADILDTLHGVPMPFVDACLLHDAVDAITERDTYMAVRMFDGTVWPVATATVRGASATFTLNTSWVDAHPSPDAPMPQEAFLRDPRVHLHGEARVFVNVADIIDATLQPS